MREPAYACLLTGPVATPRVPLEDRHDLVLGPVGGRQLSMQSAVGTGPVMPPAVGTTAHDVGAVDDQDPHPARVRNAHTQVDSEPQQENCAIPVGRPQPSSAKVRAIIDGSNNRCDRFVWTKTAEAIRPRQANPHTTSNSGHRPVLTE